MRRGALWEDRAIECVCFDASRGAWSVGYFGGRWADGGVMSYSIHSRELSPRWTTLVAEPSVHNTSIELEGKTSKHSCV